LVAPAPLVSVNDVFVNESDGDAHFVIWLDHASATAVTVSYQTVSASAVAGSDFTAVTSSVTFAPGEVVKIVDVALVNDASAEGDEQLSLKLTAATGGAVLANAQGVATIENNDGPTALSPILTVEDITVSEGPNAIATFVLKLSQPSANVTTVSFSQTSASAFSFSDYVSVADTVTFAAGETVKTVSIALIQDTIVEPNKSFFLQLSSPVGLTLWQATALATIIDNATAGPAPLVSVNDIYLNESDGDAHFAITLDRASATPITVNLQTTDDSALVGSDYVGVTSSIVFLPGEMVRTVAVHLIDDGAAEADERFGLQLTSVTGGAILGDARGTATIAHNDGPTTALPTLSIDDVVISEGALATFVLRLSQPSAGEASVSVSMFSGSAWSFSDYWPRTETIHFAAGETVKIISAPVADDTVVEPTEFFLSRWARRRG